MTDHSAQSDRNSNPLSGTKGQTSSNDLADLKSTLKRAVVTGLFGGIALIGLIENYDRFGDPQAIHADARGAALPMPGPIDNPSTTSYDPPSVQGARADRLDVVMVENPLTDLAAR